MPPTTSPLCCAPRTPRTPTGLNVASGPSSHAATGCGSAAAPRSRVRCTMTLTVLADVHAGVLAGMLTHARGVDCERSTDDAYPAACARKLPRIARIELQSGHSRGDSLVV